MTKPIHSLALASAMALAANMGLAEVTLSVSSDNNEQTLAMLNAVTAAYTAANPDITFELETRPGGADGDNLVKTSLATGEMTDIFQYNSGSLFQALKPEINLVDLSDIQGSVIESFQPVVTSPDGVVRGVPFGAAMGGGIYYNIPIYEELGLTVPKTWADFMANNAAIAAAGKVAVIQTYGDTWSSQLFVLADYFNVQAMVPNFAVDYTNNIAKYASTPAAMQGFNHLAEVFGTGNMLNPDFAAAKFDDGVRMVATGEGAHYPMLTFALGNIQQNFPDNVEDVGFFAQPGESADQNGLTVWMPSALYVAQTTEYPDEAKAFLAYVASPEGCQVMIDAAGATGPYLIKDCALPADVPRSVADMLPYFTAGLTAPALEFLSPIKGPSLEQLTVEVGSGIRPAADAAALYDQDVEKQAQQLGLPNW